MRISEKELSIIQVLDVRKGTIPISTPYIADRHSDCFVYVLSGHAEYTFGDKTVSAEKGNLIYLAHHSRYHISVTVPDYRYINVDFFFSNEEGIVYTNEIFKASSLTALETVFFTLRKFWTAGSFADRLQCKAIVCQTYAETVQAVQTGYITPERRKSIEAAISEISKRTSDPNLSIAELAELCEISEVHFRRLFQQLYHTSPLKYLSAIRIHRAKELLNTTSLAVCEISEQCGFHTPYYFSKAFREHTGMTPTDYRRHTHMLY